MLSQVSLDPPFIVHEMRMGVSMITPQKRSFQILQQILYGCEIEFDRAFEELPQCSEGKTKKVQTLRTAIFGRHKRRTDMLI